MWMKKYNLLKEYVLKNEKIPTDKTMYCSDNIGKWCNHQRQKYKKEKLSKDRINLLEEIEEWFWEKDLNGMWMKKYNLLKKYVLENGELPSQSKVYRGEKIGSWCDKQRQKYKKGKLSQERINLLEKIKLNWDLRNEMWIKKYKLLKEYVLENEKIPTDNTKYCGDNIGRWCDTQRQYYKKGKLSQERINLLEEIKGWYWERSIKTTSRPIIKSKNDKTKIRIIRVKKSKIKKLYEKYMTLT